MAQLVCLGGAVCGPLFDTATATCAVTLLQTREKVWILDNWGIVDGRVKVQRASPADHSATVGWVPATHVIIPFRGMQWKFLEADRWVNGIWALDPSEFEIDVSHSERCDLRDEELSLFEASLKAAKLPLPARDVYDSCTYVCLHLGCPIDKLVHLTIGYAAAMTEAQRRDLERALTGIKDMFFILPP